MFYRRAGFQLAACVLSIAIIAVVPFYPGQVCAKDAPMVTDVTVGWWYNDATTIKDTRRIMIMLSENGIPCSASGSALISVRVPSQDAARTKKLIVDAIRNGKIQITLVDEHGKPITREDKK
jgi:hypothetical protein